MEATRCPGGWTVRPATFDDVDRAVEMFNARSRKFYGENQSTRDDMLGWWKSRRFDLARDTQIVLDEDGRVVAWAHVTNPGEPYVAIGCGVIAHPDVEAASDLWDRLYKWALRRAREHIRLARPQARVIVVEDALATDEPRRAALERAGFSFVRVQNRMRIELDVEPPAPVWPDGISVRTAQIESDLPAIAAASAEAFRDHWGFVEQPADLTLQEWRAWVESLGETLDPTLWFIAHNGDEIAGLGLFSTRIADDPTRSYVESLSVRSAYRKRGIALALLRQGFRTLHRRGRVAVELDMDSENLTGALRLYERAGMRVIRQMMSYEKELRPGADLATRALG